MPEALGPKAARQIVTKRAKKGPGHGQRELQNNETWGVLLSLSSMRSFSDPISMLCAHERHL
jgi:hypothetical protein